MGKKINKEAFTLAEVLITLAILGIVAAVTIPSIINYQKSATALAGVQKAYSTLDTALQTAMAEHPEQSTAEFLIEPDENGKPEILNYFKIVDFGSNANYFNSGYWEVGNGAKKQADIPCDDSFVTADGMLWGITSNHMDFGGNYYFSRVFVDINGNKHGENTLGRDVFEFGFVWSPVTFYPNSKSNKDFRKNFGAIPAGSRQWENILDTMPGGDLSWQKKCDSKNLNGYCTGRILEQKKMDY